MLFSKSALQGHDLYIKLGDSTIISGANISLQPNQIHAILGQSGAGKSTLISALAGYKPLTSGTISINGKLMPSSNDLLLPGFKNVQLLTQQSQLNTFATVYDNIASQFSNTNLELKRRETGRLLDLVELRHVQSAKVSTLSGGEQQRVALARAVASQPDILLLDEPFNQLDLILAQKLQNALSQINYSLGTTILFVTHNVNEAFALNASVAFLNAGKLSVMQPPDKAYNAPSSILACQLMFQGYVLNPAIYATLDIIANMQNSQIIINPETAMLIPGSKFIVIDSQFYGYRTLYTLKPVAEEVTFQLFSHLNLQPGATIDVKNIDWYEFE